MVVFYLNNFLSSFSEGVYPERTSSPSINNAGSSGIPAASAFSGSFMISIVADLPTASRAF